MDADAGIRTHLSHRRCRALPTPPTHAFFLRLGSVRGEEGGGRAGRRTPILMQRIRRKERPKDFRAGRQTGIIMQHNGGRREGGREEETKWKRGEREREREREREAS